jgi:hypothetical protein
MNINYANEDKLAHNTNSSHWTTNNNCTIIRSHLGKFDGNGKPHLNFLKL